MRLPRSSSQSLSFRLFSISLIACSIAGPLCARSSAQQLQVSPAHVKFGAVTVGQSETQFIVLTNTGSTSATFSAISQSEAQFSISGVQLPYTLGAGNSVAVKAIFSPTGSGWTSGKAMLTSNAKNSSLSIGFTGTGVSTQALVAKPASLSFGSVAVGNKAMISVSLMNNLSRKETLQGFQMVGNGFSINGPTLPITLIPGQAVTVQITFTPQSSGAVAGNLFVSGPALNIPFNGTGTTAGQLTISPASLNFGNVMVGSAGTQTAVLTAANGPVTISSAASSNGQFSLPGVTLPFTINPGGSAQLNVSFTPQKSGNSSATLSFASNASNSQATEAATGTGTMPQVSLGWQPSTSQVQGYNVYRGTQAGSYVKINGALNTSTTYTDTTVAVRTTYYYAATAVSSNGQESGYSAPVQVVIP